MPEQPKLTLRPALVRLAIVSALCMVACGGSDDPESPEQLNAYFEAQLASAREFATDEQMPFLADGWVTPDEYEAAALAMAQCMKEQGIEFVDEVAWDETNTRIRYSYRSGSTMEEADKSSAIRDDCSKQFLNAVEWMWIVQNEPTEETLVAARAALATCLLESGFDLPPDPGPNDFAALTNQEGFWPCAEQVGAEYRIASFIG